MQKKTQQILLLQEVLIIPNENINYFYDLSHDGLLSMKRNFDMFCSTGSNIVYTSKKKKLLKQVGNKSREMMRKNDDMVLERYNRIISEVHEIIIRNRLHTESSTKKYESFVQTELWSNFMFCVCFVTHILCVHMYIERE